MYRQCYQGAAVESGPVTVVSVVEAPGPDGVVPRAAVEEGSVAVEEIVADAGVL